jgi:parvulin-like peptidyl-prolyl isomerase
MGRYLLMKGTFRMKIRYLFVLTLAALLVVGCRPITDFSTPEADIGGSEAVATVDTGAAAAPVVGQTITSTVPLAPSGGVEVALMAIKPVDGVLATVNGQEITWADYEPELNQSLHLVTLQYGIDWNQTENLDLLGSFQDDVLQTVIDRTLLRQSAANEGIEAGQEEIEARVAEETAAVLSSGQFSSWEDFLQQYGLSEAYFARLIRDSVLIEQVSEAHAPSREAEQVHARHILVADKETGQLVISRLEAGEEWGALASEFSLDTGNKDNEGDLGWFGRGVMVPAFEEAAFALEPGTMSELIETSFGYHLIQVLEKGMREVDSSTYDSMVSEAFYAWFSEQSAAAEIAIAVTFEQAE